MTNKGSVYKRKVIADLLTRSEKRIKQLTDDGTLEEFSPGYYKLVPTVQMFIKYLDSLISDDDQASNYNTEKAKLTRVKREDAELDLKVKKSELHKSKDVEFVMTNMLIAFKAKLEVLPHKARDAILSLPDDADKKEKIGKILRECIEEALNELSGYNPQSFNEESYLKALQDEE